MQDQAVGFGGGPSAHDFTRHLLQDDPMKAAADAILRVGKDLDIIYLVIMGALVFFMQVPENVLHSARSFCIHLLNLFILSHKIL
jgi:uncharacterized protein (DUF1786 family)